MYLEKKYAGMPRMRQILDNARESLVSETGSGEMYDSIGPVSLGSRLSTANIPDGYTEIVYNKGTWILHMLRMLMRGDGADPDAAYVAMVRDFITTYNGREPSTQDFKRIAEKHMTKDMDLTGEGNLDWFFDQWVYGTGIPRYSLQYTIEGSGNAFVVAGRIVQRDVSEEFLMPVPVFGDDRLLGVVIAGSEESTFRYTTSVRPARIVLDPNGTILARFDN
jgi:aminopeptidase N